MNTQRDRKFGKHIRRLRKQAKLTQEEMAEKLRLSTKYIQFIEAGARMPSLKTIYKVARALGVKVQKLFPF